MSEGVADEAMLEASAHSWPMSIFYSGKMSAVSALDIQGLVILGGAFALVVMLAMLQFRPAARKMTKGTVDIVDMQRLQARIKKGVKNGYEGVAAEAHSAGFSRKFLTYPYLTRFAACVFATLFTGYLNALAAVFAGYRTPNIQVLDLHWKSTELGTLPDLGHDIIDYAIDALGYRESWEVSDWFMLPDQIMTFIGSGMLFFIFCHPLRLQIMRRFMSIFAYVNMLRPICVLATALPDASPNCRSQFEQFHAGDLSRSHYKDQPMFRKHSFLRAFKVLFFPSEHITCGDMVFSGHTVFLIMALCVFRTYCRLERTDTPFTRFVPKWFMGLVRKIIYCLVGGGLVAIIATRLHYTLDVLIAAYLTERSWSYYHRLAFGREIMGPTIGWLEAEEVNTVDDGAYQQAKETRSRRSRGSPKKGKSGSFDEGRKKGKSGSFDEGRKKGKSGSFDKGR